MKAEKIDLYFWVGMAMGVFIMYYVYIVYGPTLEILDKQNEEIAYQKNQTKIAIAQNDRIIDNQNNNTQILKQLIQEQRVNQEQAVLYLIQILNQSNIIGNKTAEDIQKNIERVGELQQNLSEARRAQSEGIVKGFSYLIEDLDEDSDDFREILEKLAIKENITLSDSSLRDEFKIQSENQTFVFPNGTQKNLRDLFKPASCNIACFNNSDPPIRDELGTGNISAFLGGPLLTNNTIPLELRNANASENGDNEIQYYDETTNESGQISSFFGGPMITSEDVNELNSNISAQAQNQSQELDLSKYGTIEQ